MTRQLNVYLYGEHVGILSETDSGQLEFRYDFEHTYPLSVRMPADKELYDNSYAEPFFDNLTPEGNALEQIASKFHISKDNVFSVLNQIGGECAGAVSLYPDNLTVHKNIPLQEIDDNSLTEIIDNLPTNPLLTGLDKAPRLSLAGAQSKFAVYKAEDGKYYRSDDEHPTTHIIKITNKYFDNLIENELFCMSLAKTIFTDAIEVQMRTVNDRKYLEICRYDRKLTNGKVERLHQEDFCQVLGCLSKKKYQSEGGPKIPQIYDAIIKYSHRRVLDSYKFIQLLIFNYLIGNTDAHAKNFSFLHITKDNDVVLAPPYDLVAVDIYPQKIVSHDIAMTIDGKGTYASLKKSNWLALFQQLNLNTTSVMKEMQDIFYGIINDAQNLATELNDNSVTQSEIYDKILQNIKNRHAILFG